MDDYIKDHKLLMLGDLLHNPMQLNKDLVRHVASKDKAFSLFC